MITKPPPKTYNTTDDEFKQKIQKMVNQLIKTIELYFNMYLHNNIVGGHFKKIEGYNKRIKEILMIDEMRAKRISSSEEITSCFQVFKTSRTEYYMEEDMSLFNLISNFLLKL
jgi:hypothetical protein